MHGFITVQDISAVLRHHWSLQQCSTGCLYAHVKVSDAAICQIQRLLRTAHYCSGVQFIAHNLLQTIQPLALFEIRVVSTSLQASCLRVKAHASTSSVI